MEVKELKERLDGFRPFIFVSGKEIDRSNANVVEFIELYFKLTGKRVGEGTCKNCIFDAYVELSIKNENQLKRLVMPNKFKLRQGRVVIFNNTDYTNANITDDVAMKMIAFNSKHAGNFENPTEVLAAYETYRPKTKEKVTVIENKKPIEPKEVATPTKLDDLRAEYLEKKGKKPHWKWDETRLLDKLNED
jgi:hypothetical protein